MGIPSIVLALLLLAPVAAPAAAGTGDLPAGDLPASGGAEVVPVGDLSPSGDAEIVSTRAEGERLVTLEVESPSVGRTFVSLLLPSRYKAEPVRTWPVLFLLHGANNDHTTWLSQTDVEALTADLDVIVVMPDGGQYGFYSDWWERGESGLSGWETYHLEELPRILAHEFRAADARAVAGNSMGGFGAISYAARRPGMFQAAASFSGVLDVFALGRLGEDIWGDRQEQRANWQAHDPISLAPALEGTALYVAWGNGEPGPLDAEGTRFDVLEAWLAAGNERFVERITEIGLPATIESYGPGTHAWPYWEAALEDALPLLMTSLGVPPTP